MTRSIKAIEMRDYVEILYPKDLPAQTYTDKNGVEHISDQKSREDEIGAFRISINHDSMSMTLQAPLRLVERQYDAIKMHLEDLGESKARSGQRFHGGDILDIVVWLKTDEGMIAGVSRGWIWHHSKITIGVEPGRARFLMQGTREEVDYTGMGACGRYNVKRGYRHLVVEARIPGAGDIGA